MSDETNGIDQELFSRFIQNRVANSKVDFTKENTKERFVVINTLFKIMIGTYGEMFARQFDNQYSKDIWFNALLVFSTEDIANGIELMLQDTKFTSVPHLKKFIQYCTDAADGKNYIKEKQLTAEKLRLPKLKKGQNNI